MVKRKSAAAGLATFWVVSEVVPERFLSVPITHERMFAEFARLGQVEAARPPRDLRAVEVG
jgi:hypothetical protein